MNFDELRRRLIAKLPFYASIINSVQIMETDIMTPVVATNGKDIYYNPKALKTLTADQILFAFANAICHIGFNDVTRMEGKNALVWNMATDAVINDFLRKDGFTDIEKSVNIPDASSLNAEDLYNQLMDEAKKTGRVQMNGEDIVRVEL